MSNMTMTVAEFTRLLEVYGAERTRWPVEARAAAAHLMSADAAARRLLAEAEALDLVLERAPVPAQSVEGALAERIVASAQRSPRIVRLPGVLRGADLATGAAQARPVGLTASAKDVGGRRVRRRSWLLGQEVAAAGLLAASLVMGVVIGNSSLPSELFPGLTDLTTGLTSDSDSLVRIALSDEDMQ